MWNRTSGNEVIVHRSSRVEAEQAISDLQKRGYEIIYPLTEQTSCGKTFSTDGYRPVFMGNTFSCKYVAKLRRIVN
ncbi:hypothetical protein M670_00159 [Schinkia azotoformans MEV2011]|uniref:Uncharacterized protein n=1 Tax=Schinkia azotoformans MEV2011 TaxID=1348973 RepID=A0A072NTH3_SCHAZ|nr:hypothetical protein [Schinkia azotoformans]KEF40143.1 hypothetical protein M670_00159 [Schinkia azotoformans MEV2011]